MVEPNVLEAFHMMWDKFPEPVLLINNHREIQALNERARKSGLAVGSKCSSIGAPELHTRQCCRADEMLASGQPQQLLKKNPADKWSVAHWVPVLGHPDLYVHFNAVLPENCQPDASALPC